MGKKSNAVRKAMKRNIRSDGLSEEQLKFLKENSKYEGSPYHKRNPGDFGLSPPAAPRRDKTLCDEAGIFKKKEAEALLEKAINVGLVSESENSDGFPRQIWVVDDRGRAFEAIYGGSCRGAYHGYPIRCNEPFFDKLHSAWKARQKCN